MIVPDINLLIYAHNPDSPEHSVASRWWNELLEGSEYGAGSRTAYQRRRFARFPGLRWRNPLL